MDKAIMAKYDNLLERLNKWERSASERLRQQILIPVFSTNMCVMHNSMIAYEQGRPWKEMPSNYYQLGRFYNWKQKQIWDIKRRLSNHFYAKYIAASR